jgi:CRISPR-associated protein Csm5
MKYKVTVETLTPLHIGTGTELLAKFDYVSKPGERMTCVLDQDAVYADELERNGAKAQLDKPAGVLLSSENWHEGSRFVRYAMGGSTNLERAREQIKDAYGRCYLPGSSLKGALRTALLAYARMSGATAQASVNYASKRSGYVKESAAANLEAAAFRSPGNNDANHDLLRALQVADSAALPHSPSPLELQEARVFTDASEKPGAPIAVETIRQKVIFETLIVVDELTLQYAEKLHWGDKPAWLERLTEVLQQVSQRRIAEGMETAQAKGFARTAEFYKQLAATAEACRGKNAAVLQMSWGTGWTGITIGPQLSKAEQDAVREKFELGRPQGWKGRWQPGLEQPFPKSRRLGRIASQVTDDQPGKPLGWVLLAFAPEEFGFEEKRKIWTKLNDRAQVDFKPLPQVTQTPFIDPSATPPRASAPESKSAPQSKPARPAPGTRALISSFTEPPKVGDRFKGELFEIIGRQLLLSIPGLEDTVAYAVIEAEDNAGSKKYREGESVVCEVIRLTQEGKTWRAQCHHG